MPDITVGFAGLTHLGICSLTAAAAKQFSVVGWQDDADLVARLREGDLPISEPGLEDLFDDLQPRMSFETDPASLGACDLVYVAFDVPTDDSGQSDLGPIDEVLERIAPHLADDAILVILCQVPPGFTTAHADIHPNLFYQVETLVFGRAVERACEPERIIIGAANPGEALPEAYRQFLEAFDCPLMPMRYESAELCKIAINCFLVASVSTANTLADLCEGLDADWSEIVPALRLDARIGPSAYIQPGLGISGGNLERDLTTVSRLAAAAGSDASVIETYRRHSGYAKGWPHRVLGEYFGADLSGAGLAILGLSYKEETHSTKNSPALLLLDKLDGMSVRAYDPLVKDVELTGLNHAGSALDALDGVDAVCLMTPWAEFREIDPKAAAAKMAGRLVVDPYGMWDTRQCLDAGLVHAVRGRVVTGKEE